MHTFVLDFAIEAAMRYSGLDYIVII